jgi:molybdopterin-guanine dinucleotide biosynthesis protein
VNKPLLIGIGGAHSGIGKTTIAAALLTYFTTGCGESTDKGPFSSVTHHSSLITFQRWGAIKFTKTAFYTSIIDDPALLSQSDKDTGKLLEAGAHDVLWVQAPPEDLEEVLSRALGRLSHCDAVIIEGNSAIEFLKPDIVIFISNSSKKRIKASAHRVLKQADIIAIPEEQREEMPCDGANAHCFLYVDPGNQDTLRELAACMDTTIRQKSIEKALKEKSVAGRISCPLARKIAEELGISYKEVGETANALKIKIKNCELGCF